MSETPHELHDEYQFQAITDNRDCSPKRLAAQPVIEAAKADDEEVVVAVDASSQPVNPKRTAIEVVA